MILEEIIARIAHTGQFRRDGVTPYIRHVEGVVAGVETDKQKRIAWLHDVVEDTPITLVDLLNMGVRAEVVEGVSMMTKKKGIPYSEYIEGIKIDKDVVAVKIADIQYNMNDSPTPRAKEKYDKALKILNS